MVRFWNAIRRIRLPPRAEVVASLRHWIRTQGRWYAISAAVHFLALVCVLLLPGTILKIEPGAAPSFETPESEQLPLLDLTHFNLGDQPLDPSKVNTEVITTVDQPGHKAEYNDASLVFQHAGGGTPQGADQPSLGGLGGFNVRSFLSGARVTGHGGVGNGLGAGTHAGSGGAGEGFGGRGSGNRKEMLGAHGGTPGTERAVAAALNWFQRHQESGGNWSLKLFARHCKDHVCSGQSELKEDAGATALAILTYLAAGQTHKTSGMYRDTIHKGLFWLVKRQTSEGNLASGCEQPMYAHGLATIALCEAFGMSNDPHLANAAQSAVFYIEQAQSQDTGGWRYYPGDPGDTSVFGWEVMALKSAQMAGLAVNSMNLERCRHWLQLVAKGQSGGLSAYQQYREPSPTMTAAALLCRQYLGARADSPAMIEGREYLKANPPLNSENTVRDTYYWYYATQVMFNLGGPDWDDWNRTMRRTLIETQCRDGCAAGSWDPQRPTPDIWSMKGGRIVTTALATLTLEIYYRYLPLYRIRNPQDRPAAPPATGPEPMIVRNPANPLLPDKPAAAPPPPPSHGIGL